jgi:hypothetical protein
LETAMHTLKKIYTTPLLLFFLPFRNICCPPPPLYPEKWLRGCHFVPLLALSVVDYSFKRGGTHKSLVIFPMKTNPPFSSFPKTFETVSTCLNRNNPSRWDQVEMDRLVVDKFSSSSSSPCVCLCVSVGSVHWATCPASKRASTTSSSSQLVYRTRVNGGDEVISEIDVGMHFNVSVGRRRGWWLGGVRREIEGRTFNWQDRRLRRSQIIKDGNRKTVYGNISNRALFAPGTPMRICV